MLFSRATRHRANTQYLAQGRLSYCNRTVKYTVNVGECTAQRNSLKCITCSLRNNLTQDSAHYRDPCNIPTKRKGDRVKCLRDMRDTDRYNDRFTDRDWWDYVQSPYHSGSIRPCNQHQTGNHWMTSQHPMPRGRNGYFRYINDTQPMYVPALWSGTRDCDRDVFCVYCRGLFSLFQSAYTK